MKCVKVPRVVCPKCKKSSNAYESLSVHPGYFEYGIKFECPRCKNEVMFYTGDEISREGEILRGAIVCVDVPTIRVKDFYEVR